MDNSDTLFYSVEIEGGKERNDHKTSSNSLQERRAARKNRIAKREEAIKRHEIFLSGKFEELDEEEPIGPVEKQIAECTAVLEHLLHDGDENVTNIRIANDAREVARRFAESQKKRELLSKLEDDAALAQEKFNEISSRWSTILELNDPLTIESEIKSQKEKCDDLMFQKNAVIVELKKELKEADKAFFQGLERKLNDIKELGERIDAQVMLMKNAYRSQLQLIESSIEIDRANVINKNEKYWNELYLKRNNDEMENIESKLLQISEFKKNIQLLTLQHKEKYRTTKIQLENEIETLQKELQNLKASCLINSEKMDYTFHLLRQREEENASVKSQQKRRLNKMQDVINELKHKIKELDRHGLIQKQKSHREIAKLKNSLSDLQTKADYFAMANERKYQQVWKMNKEKTKTIIKNINQIDEIIHEQILGIGWTPTKLDVLKQSDLPSYTKTTQNYQDENKTCSESTSSSENISPNIDNKPREKLVGHILKMIADSSGFLIENRLWSLLEGYQQSPIDLCKIDNIFNALNITSDNDIELIQKYFLQYAYCIECKNQPKFYDLTGADSPKITIRDFSDDKIHAGSSLKLQCKEGHPLMIEPSYTLNALQEFVSKHKIIKDIIEENPIFISRQLSNKDVTHYWQRYKDVFSSHKEKLWDNLMIGLNKYLPILQERHKLNEDVIQLRKQNSELKNLLRGHAPSKEVPKQKYLTPLNTNF